MCFVRWCTNLFIYLFTFCCYWCVVFFLLFVFFSWICIPLMHDGRPTQQLLLKLTYLEFAADLFFFPPPALSRPEGVLRSFKWFTRVLLVTFLFDPPRRRVVSEQFRNDYWSSWKMHDWQLPGFVVARDFSRHVFFFSDCARTFCCMIDRDLFWDSWKLIVVVLFFYLHLQCLSV